MMVGQFLINWMIRSAILIIAGAILLQIFRVRNASFRMATWTAMLLASAAIPVLNGIVPGIPVVVPRDAPAFLRESKIAALAVMSTTAPLPEIPGPAGYDGVAKRRPGLALMQRVNSGVHWGAAIVAIYVLVCTILLLRIGVGLAVGAQLRRGSTRVALNDFRESNKVNAPVTLGIVRPEIVLPMDWREWDGARLNAVLAHERSHVQRWDPAVQCFSAIHRALLWASPLSWFLHAKIAQTAEEVSDNAAATVCDRVRYAEILLAFMKREAHGPIPAGLPMARYGDPEKRLLRILDQPVISRGLSKRAAAAIIGFSVTATFLIAATKAEFAPRFNEIWQLPAPAVSYPAPPSEVSGHKILVKKAYVPAARPALAQIVAQAPAPATAAPAASPSPSEVRLTLSVTDPAGRYVTGLAAQDFRVTSGQTSPDISSFGLTEAKHCVVLLNTIAEGDDAVNALGGVLDTRDQLAVLAGAPASDPDAFWNAVLGAVNRAKEMSNPYKSVVVMMQGGTLNPMAGEPDLAKIIRAALHSPRVAVSFASIEDIPKPSVGTLSQQDDLRIVAAVTGGQVVPTPSAGEIPSFVTRIAVGLINQYVLGFIPANERAGALARPPTVEVVAHAGLPPLRVIGPGGYYVEP